MDTRRVLIEAAIVSPSDIHRNLSPTNKPEILFVL